MKKIPTIFKRNQENMKELLNEPHPDCDWVFKGEGTATRKYDGTCCLVKEGKLYKRREIKKGKPIPEEFEMADHDEVTGKTVGWMPVTDSAEDVWHREAFTGKELDGTYELCGPKIQKNPENFHIHVIFSRSHVLISHNTAQIFPSVERTFDGIKTFLAGVDTEGIVFHHPDGRMAKIKKRDYGQTRT